MTQIELKSFLPVAGNHPKVLILGSMPSATSLKMNQYYAYPRNQFWHIIFELLTGKALTLPHTEVPYEDKLGLLLKNNIALWDVIEVCNRKGSLDTDIRNEAPQNFNGFYEAHPSIRHVLFNGGKAHSVYRRSVGFSANFTYWVLPSTSPAHTLAYDKKLEAWSLLKHLISET